MIGDLVERGNGLGPVTVVAGTTDDAAAAGRLLAGAFHDLPTTRVLVPDPTRRAEIMPGYMRMWSEYAAMPPDRSRFGAGGLDLAYNTAGDLVGVLVVFNCTLGPLRLPTDFEERLANVTGERLEYFARFHDGLDRIAPTGAGYQHLAFVGSAEPGAGRALIERALTNNDNLVNNNWYLEAVPARVEYFAGFGFAAIPAGAIIDGQTMAVGMWRPAKALMR